MKKKLSFVKVRLDISRKPSYHLYITRDEENDRQLMRIPTCNGNILIEINNDDVNRPYWCVDLIDFKGKVLQ